MSQTQRILAQILALLALAGGLGGYAYLVVFKKEAKLALKHEHEMRLFAPQNLEERASDGGAPAARFRELRITFQGTTTVLERADSNDWWLKSPVKAKADKLAVDNILSLLQTSKFKSTIETDPDREALRKYGLLAPSFVVEASAEVNQEIRRAKLVGGIENTFDGTVFIQRNDEKPVFAAEGGVRYSMAKTPFDLRDKSPFLVDEAKVEAIVMKSQHNEYRLERAGDKLWNLTKPSHEPADASTVLSMISGFGSERAQAFPDDTPAQRQALGLETPLIETKLTLTGGEIVRFRVSRGRADAGDLLFALREDRTGTVLAQVGDGATQYDRNPRDLRDKTLVRFRREAVTKIVLRDLHGPEIWVAKDSVDASAESWRIIAPRPGRAKIFKITSALWTLSGAKALATGETKPKDWGKYGLGGPSKYVALFDQEGKELARLEIGKPVPGTPSAVYVRGSRDQVLESDGSRLGELPFTLLDVLDEPADAGVDGGLTSP